MSKTKWDGAEEPKINNFLNIVLLVLIDPSYTHQYVNKVIIKLQMIIFTPLFY